MTHNSNKFHYKSEVPKKAAPTTEKFVHRVVEMLKNIVEDNEKFREIYDEDYFKPFQNSQQPRITMVSCADSRCHTHSYDFTPDNDVFLIRNIGNQIESNLGSVEYGVNHLGTPILMFLGHSGCGAVKAMYDGKYGELEPAIQKELIHIRDNIDKNASFEENIILNIKKQVKIACEHFREKLNQSHPQNPLLGNPNDGKLVIIGALYDFDNFYKHGTGKLSFISINNEDNDMIAEGVSLESFIKSCGSTEECVRAIESGRYETHKGHHTLKPKSK